MSGKAPRIKSEQMSVISEASSINPEAVSEALNKQEL